MHFFSPVERMPLLEVIPTEATSPDTIVTAVRFGRRMGKTVIVVADRPGFWVNRILSPYLNEAGHLLQEGVPIELIDRTMTQFGFPVGPVALLDEVGLDVAQKAGSVMHEAFGDRMKPAASLPRMLGATRLGRKNGRGFYHYKAGHKAGVDRSVYPLLGVRPSDEVDEELVERRLVYSMLNEAALACADRVVRSPRDADIGAIFGIGFPAFRGGPLRMIDDLGPEPGGRDALPAAGAVRRAVPPGAVAARDGHAREAGTIPRDAAPRDSGCSRMTWTLGDGCAAVPLHPGPALAGFESRLIYFPGAERTLTPPPARLGLPVERVEIPTDDGVTLVGWVMPAQRIRPASGCSSATATPAISRVRPAGALCRPAAAWASTSWPSTTEDTAKAGGAPASRACTGMPMPRTGTCGRSAACPPTGSSSSVTRSDRRWRSIWRAGSPRPG